MLHLARGNAASFVGALPDAFLWLDVEEENQAGVDERRLAALFINDCLEKGRRILLHSSHGRHRTRWAFVAYKIYNGQSVPSALRQAAASPWLSPYLTDTGLWDRFALSCR